VADLGQTSLPAGKYTQLRLVLVENGATAPFPNAVVPIGGSETDLKVPSGSQSGLKIDADVDVVAGKTTRLVLDFDACKSVVRRGNSGQFNLRPVISAIPLTSEVGLRSPAMSRRDWRTRRPRSRSRSTVCRCDRLPRKSTGRFVLYPVPSGAYDLVVTSGGRRRRRRDRVPVTAAAPTTVSMRSAADRTAAVVERGVSGTVNPPRPPCGPCRR
jgi:hypothetical protein